VTSAEAVGSSLPAHNPPFVDARSLADALPPAEAIDAVERAFADIV